MSPAEAPRLDHLWRLTDDTGVIQHALGPIPDRRTGYTADDNARALLVAVMAGRHGYPEAARLAHTYLGFLLYALQPDGWFHNNFSYDRRPIPEERSEDCQVRCLWALAEAARFWGGEGAGWVATRLFAAGAETAIGIRTPRGLAGLCAAFAAWLEPEGRPGALAAAGLDRRVADLLRRAAVELAAMFAGRRRPGWHWCEEILTYDNAMLPYGLLRASHLTGDARQRRQALHGLEFLVEVTWRGDLFWPVGNRGWFPAGGTAAAYDQQPLEAAGTVLACLQAHRVTGLAAWRARASQARDWFLGRNALGLPLYDATTGGCRDGLTPTGCNLNQGAESTLAWLTAALAFPRKGWLRGDACGRVGEDGGEAVGTRGVVRSHDAVRGQDPGGAGRPRAQPAVPQAEAGDAARAVRHRRVANR